MPREESAEVEEEKRARSAYDLIRMRLDRLEQNISKPAPIPQRREQLKAPRAPPEFVRNVVGSSAAAGSAEFHIFRNNRRKEMNRLDYIEKKAKLEEQQEEFTRKRSEIEKAEEEKTAKKRAKRLRKKERMKRRKKNQDNCSSDSGSESESEDEAQAQTTPEQGVEKAKPDAVDTNDEEDQVNPENKG